MKQKIPKISSGFFYFNYAPVRFYTNLGENLTGIICRYNVPLKACSLSIDSNNALKLPAPKPLAPMR